MGFAEVLDVLLKERGAAAKLSSEAGINERLIGYWRKGEKQPTLENIVKLCRYFDMSADELLDIEKPATPEGEKPAPSERQLLVKEISEGLSSLDTAKLKALREFLD